MSKGKSEAPLHAPLSAETIQSKRISVIWIVPIVAAVVAGWLVYDRVRNVGPTITIVFADGQGLQAGQTAVRYRGVKVGDVRSVSLADDGQNVEARAALDKSAKNLARQGALFWVVRPEVSAGGLRGLDTLVSGTYIQVQPGTGKEQKKFTGLENPPIISSTKPGLEIDLTSPELGSLTLGAPVYYRGMEVGSVEFYSLSDDATQIKVRVRIDNRYASLVTQDTKFWNAGGLNVSLRLFGVNMSAESMKSLVAGGIAFATPPVPGPPVAKGTVFPLYAKPDEKWLKWTTPLPGWEQNKSMEARNE
jgi:paraquat-inducible protein B